jgi:oxygen-independent coproporphyrinogen-3 oxidase
LGLREIPPIRQQAVSELEEEGLVSLESGRMVPTLKGRLLNDMVIERVLDAVGS